MAVSVIVGEGSGGRSGMSAYEPELVWLAFAAMPGWARLRYDYAAPDTKIYETVYSPSR